MKHLTKIEAAPGTAEFHEQAAARALAELAAFDPADARFGTLSYHISQSVDDILTQREMTQKDLAKKLNVSEGALSRMLRQDRNLTLRTLAQIEAALQVELFNPSRDFRTPEERMQAAGRDIQLGIALQMPAPQYWNDSEQCVTSPDNLEEETSELYKLAS
jgi:transcriptional regulator with XRE-family HTH domain